jgi:hypothetical protein
MGPSSTLSLGDDVSAREAGLQPRSPSGCSHGLVAVAGAIGYSSCSNQENLATPGKISISIATPAAPATVQGLSAASWPPQVCAPHGLAGLCKRRLLPEPVLNFTDPSILMCQEKLQPEEPFYSPRLTLHPKSTLCTSLQPCRLSTHNCSRCTWRDP